MSSMGSGACWWRGRRRRGVLGVGGGVIESGELAVDRTHKDFYGIGELDNMGQGWLWSVRYPQSAGKRIVRVGRVVSGEEALCAWA